MRLTLLFLFLSIPLFAQLPSWKGFTGPGYVYFGFNGGGQPGSPGASGPNIFTTATSSDGLTNWRNAGGLWNDYVSKPSSGTLFPYQINAPDAAVIGGNVFLHVTSANDENLNLVTWIIAQANTTTGEVSTLVSIDWTSQISGVTVCFAGGWVRNADSTIYVDGSNNVHLHVPCSIGGSSSFIVYETHAAASNLASWSAPVNVNVAQSNTYDPQAYLIAGTFYMWCKDATGSFITLASSSSVTGPYAMLKTGNWAGWGSGFEGPFAYPQPGGTSWYLMFEAFATTHQMFYSSCSTLDFTACTWTAKTAWTEDAIYRHGAVIHVP